MLDSASSNAGGARSGRSTSVFLGEKACVQLSGSPVSPEFDFSLDGEKPVRLSSSCTCGAAVLRDRFMGPLIVSGVHGNYFGTEFSMQSGGVPPIELFFI